MCERCIWCGSDPQYVAYHDQEWGVAVRDDRALFAKLTLDMFQSGLSWLVVLRKRADMVSLLHLDDPGRLARMGSEEIERVLVDARIIRNRAKVEAAVGNARIWCDLAEQGRSFSDLLWSHVQGTTVVNSWRRDEDVPARTPEGDEMASTLKRLGFKWTGPTVCYAFMQAVGMVNDHLVSCFRHEYCSDQASSGRVGRR